MSPSYKFVVGHLETMLDWGMNLFSILLRQKKLTNTCFLEKV